MYLKGQKLEVALHSLHREYKNVQKSVLTNVNIQRTGKTSLQMFVYFIFDGSFICRFLYISVPPPSLGIVSVPHNWMYTYWLSITYICRFYILHRKVDSAWVNKLFPPMTYREQVKRLLSSYYFDRYSRKSISTIRNSLLVSFPFLAL